MDQWNVSDKRDYYTNETINFTILGLIVFVYDDGTVVRRIGKISRCKMF